MNLIDQFRIRQFRRLDAAQQLRAVQNADWQRDRSLILYVLENEQFRLKAAAVQKLPYPEERERIVRIAGEDPDDFVRDHAVEMLRYPEDRDVLIGLAQSDAGFHLVERAVKKLPWPREKEILLALAAADHYPVHAVKALDAEEAVPELENLALHSPDRDARKAAAEKLSFPRSRDVLEQCVLSANDMPEKYKLVLKFPYPEARDFLVRLALNGPFRTAAVCRLPWPGERKTLEAVAHTVPGADADQDLSNAIRVSQFIMAKNGVCPLCGGEVISQPPVGSVNDDPGDVCEQTAELTCTRCGWSMASE